MIITKTENNETIIIKTDDNDIKSIKSIKRRLTNDSSVKY